MEDLLYKAISYGRELGLEFIDIRIDDYTINSITIRDSAVTSSSINVKGASIRVLSEGVIGFAATGIVNKDSLKRAIDSAYRQVKAFKGLTEKMGVYTVSSRHDVVKEKPIVDPRDVGFDVKISDLSELRDLISKLDSRIKATTINYADIAGRKYYISSEDRYIEQDMYYTWLYIWVSAREADILASARLETGTRQGYALFKKYGIEDIAKKIVGRVEKQFRAKTPRGGSFPVILAPEVVGVFTHEAFGHLAEADLTLSGSILRDKVGKKVASKLVTIVDDPLIPDAFGTFKYDDEGIEAYPVTIVEKGILKQLMTDRIYASITNSKPTGNARAQDYNVPPLIRMRTTYIKPGDMSIEELFEGIDFGYYVVSFRGGQANLDGTFQVGIQEAYEIVNGEIGDPVRNMSISGNTIETLHNVTGVAKDFEIGYGRCGKGQTVYVSDGGPHIRVEKLMVGGRA
ncbi:MAG: TldD/PmbA family protein [Desulfurococcales archaeon]|nr:TldD/PmbA family protein [Desulfurococcales archaeon]